MKKMAGASENTIKEDDSLNPNLGTAEAIKLRREKFQKKKFGSLISFMEKS